MDIKLCMNMKKYLESTRIATLLAKRALHSLTAAERGELDSLLTKTGINPEDIFKNSSFIVPDENEIEAQQKVFDAVRGQIAGSGNSRKVRFRPVTVGERVSGLSSGIKLRRYLPYAAMFVVVLALSLFAYYSIYDSKTVLKPHNDSIMAYSDKTVLVLPNGESVVQSNSTNVADVILSAKEAASANISAKTEIGNGASKRVAEVYKIKVSRGATHRVVLEDGTSIVLYPESELEFPEFFGSKERSVKLIGEGYFDVTKDASRPFTVKTGSASVTVLGTSFNIRAYENESVTETVLVTGKVLMNSTPLVPNQIAILDRANMDVRVESIDASVYTERAMGMFVFENRSLDEIMREFSHWFGFEYSFENPDLRDKKFRIKLPRTDNFNLLMDLMEKTGEMVFVVNDKNIEIKSVKR